MKKGVQLLICVLVCLSVGALAGLATASGVNSWYRYIEKPFFNPPNYLFAPVWSLLYLLMGVSLFMILQDKLHTLKTKALAVFALQLFLNFCWSFLFFKFQLLGWACIEIVAMWLSIIAMILVFRRINKPAAWLQLPYLLWVSFASILNMSIWYLNK